MTTPWTTPTIVEQYSEEGAENVHIPWDSTNGFANLKSSNEQSVGTMDALYHISRSPKHDINSKTYYLRATGYNFTNIPEVVSGIEVRVKANRRGRVTDDTVQLCLNRELIGENMASLDLAPIKVYGGPEDLWAATNLSIVNVTDSSFGVVLRFKSHPKWPHRDPIFIDTVEIRIH